MTVDVYERHWCSIEIVSDTIFMLSSLFTPKILCIELKYMYSALFKIYVTNRDPCGKEARIN